MLDDIRIARPCGADWARMSGDDRKRFCELCRLHVYDLSGMKRDEAEAFVRANEGSACVRFHRRADGTLMTQDCPVGLAAVKRKVALAAASLVSLASLALGAVLGVRAIAGSRWVPGAALVPTRQRDQIIMGKMSIRR